MSEQAKQEIVLNDLDECLKFIEENRNDIAEGRYDLLLERDWAKHISDDDLLILARACPGSRLAIATATKSAELLKILSSDASEDVREAVADNPRATAGILDRLATDSVAAVRMAAASNLNVSANRLEALAKDPVNYVRWSVAHNEKTPSHIIEILIKDADRHISDEARKHPNAPKRGFFARLLKKG